ncbi:MAG: response regulator transcription factor [Clostridiales bacterium]|nr:response regulator transcription factor [Clostridiales bacterium]
MKHILIIDRDESTAELERDYLEMNSFIVTIEKCGVSGFQRALQEDIDMVITELDFEDLSGFELCRELRGRRDIPIMIVSSKSSEIDKVRSFGVGADDYIVKPFSPNELVARAKAHLNCYVRLMKKGERENNCICLRTIKIDMTARRVTAEGKEIPFTTKEFDLLVFLASHPNQVFSKDELFREVWGMHSIGDVATVTVHIKKIRQKLEKYTEGLNCIETVWGAGYRFQLSESADEEEE